MKSCSTNHLTGTHVLVDWQKEEKYSDWLTWYNKDFHNKKHKDLVRMVFIIITIFSLLSLFIDYYYLFIYYATN